MADFVKFQKTSGNLAKGFFNLATDTIKLAFSNVAPNAATAEKLSDITQIATAGGYVAGGITVTGTSVTQTGGTAALVGSDAEFTATGEVGPLRYVIAYDDTSADDLLLGYWDRGNSVTLYENDKLTIDFGAAILSLA